MFVENKENIISTPVAVEVSKQPEAPQRKQGRYARRGLSGSATYMSWEGMQQRCFDKKHSSYHCYGGRGITMCPRWRVFDYFYQDMGQRPAGAKLVRLDKNQPYSKENCKWGNDKDVARNSSRTHFVTIFGETKSLTEWAQDPRCVVNYPVFKARIRQGKNPEVALRMAQQWVKKKKQEPGQDAEVAIAV